MKQLRGAITSQVIWNGETLGPEAVRNLANYWRSVSTELANVLDVPADEPIHNEYCWMHSGAPGLGGWCCQHEECRVGGKEQS